MIAVAQLSARVEDIDYHTPRGLDRGLFLKLTVCDFIRERRNHVAHPPMRRRQKLARLCGSGTRPRLWHNHISAHKGSPTKRNRIGFNATPKMIAVAQLFARPGGSTGTSRARRRVSCKGTPHRARVPPVDYRDGLSPCHRNLLFPPRA
jgi:hypothetical protein